jgi:hypothetical protein
MAAFSAATSFVCGTEDAFESTLREEGRPHEPGIGGGVGTAVGLRPLRHAEAAT